MKSLKYLWTIKWNWSETETEIISGFFDSKFSIDGLFSGNKFSLLDWVDDVEELGADTAGKLEVGVGKFPGKYNSF